ncbi:MAG: hypothetical protein R3B95_10130 [Nitrospirales bacterium]|nr:hypothetical protein [Nitrospirales bacterium]
MLGFAGEVPHEQLVWFYNAADVCCLLSERGRVAQCYRGIVGTNGTRVGHFCRRYTRNCYVSQGGNVGGKKAGARGDGLEEDSLERTWSKSEILKYAQQYSGDQTADEVKEVFSLC